MAKAKRRLKSHPAAETSPADSSVSASELQISEKGSWVRRGRQLALAILGGLLVYVAYFPSDSIQVELGDALWFVVLSLLLWTVTFATEPLARREQIRSARVDPAISNRFSVSDWLGGRLLLDVVVWNLALWMVVAALAMCPPGNLRQATNEAWFWIGAAACFTAARRLMAHRQARRCVWVLLVAISFTMAVHALHQAWVSLPRLRAEYLANPEDVLRQAGMVAPRGSARRMLFANRLLDGGPTATFALANSLAAVLMVGVIVAAGLMISPADRTPFRTDPETQTKHDRSWGERVLLLLFVLIGLAAILATRSRSALLACLLGIAIVWGLQLRSRLMDAASDKPSNSKRWLAIGALLALGGGLFCGVLLWGDAEWIDAASASLEFRLQYWKSTLALIADHPLFGAGPGGFKSMYLRYRLPVASESIADPHNFFFETMASGGLPAGLLLIAVFAIGFRCCQKGSSIDSDARDFGMEANGSQATATWLLSGAGASLGLIWLFGMLSRQLPDWEASLFALPVGAGASYFVSRLMRHTSSAAMSAMAFAVFVSVMVHLLVSGGWTVPGVVIVIWVVAAMGCRSESETELLHRKDGEGKGEDSSDTHSHADRPKTVAIFALIGGALLLLTLRAVSIVPHQEAQASLGRAQDAAVRGLTNKADQEIQAAIQSDLWSGDAARWRMELLANQLRQQRVRPAVREAWLQSIEVVQQRSGLDPSLLRSIGEQFLHLYQRFGEREDLDAAAEWIGRAIDANPTEVSLVAQAALIAQQRSNLAGEDGRGAGGDQAIELAERRNAIQLAKRATALSQIQANVVRKLELQHAMVAKPLGAAATMQPISAPISELFQKQLLLSDEPGDRAVRSN